MGFISRWLSTSRRAVDESLLTVEDLIPTPGVATDDELATLLGRELRRNYVEGGEVADLLEKMGASAVAQHLRDHRFPSKTIQRHGDFGEVLAGAIFRHDRRYCVPILKLRYKQRRNIPLPGADVLGFRFTGPRPIVAVPEVKTRTTRKRGLLLEANQSLNNIVPGGLAEAIAFVHARFRRTNPALAGRIAELLAPSADYLIERFFVIVHEAGTWREDVVTAAKPGIENATTVLLVRIDGLAKLVTNAYERAADG